MTSLLIAAISLGFLGSFHCIGMCGPIALSLPVHQYGGLKKNFAIILYNAGRIFTYSVLGILFGSLGQSFYMAGFQQWVSISIGVLLLLSVLMPGIWFFKSVRFSFLTNPVNRLKNYFSELFSKRGLRFLFLIGVLNGLLPCGLVYLGIAGAIATEDIFKGALFMVGFGLGTLPIMYSVALFGQFVSLRFRTIIRSAVPYVISAMALLLILRGMNLGIPYISPSFEVKEKTMNCCEHGHCEKE